MTLTDIELVTLDGRPTTLGAYTGAALLVVNVASRCGLTPQYTGLEELQKTFSSRGFSVLGFPRLLLPVQPLHGPGAGHGG